MEERLKYYGDNPFGFSKPAIATKR